MTTRMYWCLAVASGVLLSCATVGGAPGARSLGGGAEGLALVVQQGHSSGVRAIAFSPDGRLVATAGSDGEAVLWEAATGIQLRSLRGHAKDVFVVAFTPDGKSLLTAGEDGTAKLWDPITGQLLKTFAGHTNPIYGAAFSADGTKLLTGSGDHTTRLWDVATGTTLITLQERASHVALSPDGKLAMTAQGIEKEPAKLWDLSTGQVVRTFAGREDDYVQSMRFSSDGKRALIANGDATKTAELWDVATGELIQTFAGHERGISGAVFTADERGVFTGSWDKTARLWDATTGKLLRTFSGHSEIIQGVAMSQDGKYVATASGDRSGKLWDLNSGRELRSFGGVAPRVDAVAWSPDGERVATANSDGTASVWDLTTGKLVLRLVGHEDAIKSVAFSPDGRQIVTGSVDSTTRIWNAESGTLVKTLRERNMVQLVAYTADGSGVITGDDDNNATLWDVASGKSVRTFSGRRIMSFGVAISGDRGTVLTAQGHGKPTLWDVATGEKRESALGHDDGEAVFLGDASKAISPDGRIVVTDRFAKGVALWDVATGRNIRTLDGHYTQQENSSVVNAINSPAFSPDGQRLVAGGFDGNARIWDVTTGALLQTLQGHGDIVRAAAFSPDGKSVITGSDDATTKIWDATTGQLKGTLMSLEQPDWAVSTPDGSYMSSRTAVKGVHFVRGTAAYGFENFDLLYNRPDLVVQQLGFAPQAVVSAYGQAHLKRLKRLGFTEDQIKLDVHLPEIAVASDALPIETQARHLAFSVHASDTKYTLDRIDVLVNDVPVFGGQGISVRNQNSADLTKEIVLDLSEGSNKVQVSVRNSAGAESLTQSFSIVYAVSPAKHDLYVVAIGVSDYDAADMKLTYAAKDAKDLIALLKGDREAFGEIKTLALLDKEASREAILKSKAFLQQSKIDDEVVLFVAGHGLLNDSLDWYFGTHDVDFSQPASRGVSYDEIEGLLDGIPARNKLLLMDACNSGEVDKPDSVLVAAGDAASGPVKSRGFKRVKSKTAVGLLNSFELMQELFANLERGSGATVIASAGGAEFAYESSDWNNGVFTYSLLNGLQTKTADANHDGRVTASELGAFVSHSVETLTNGRQHPTSRKSNAEVDFRVY